MRVISCMILLAVASTTLTGCSLFKKNTNGAPGPAGAGGPAPAKFPGGNDPILNGNFGNPPPQFPPAPPPGPQGGAKGPTTILAGTVTDAYHRPVSNAYIRLVSADAKEGAAPVEVAADARGHFIIQGVKTGQSYKLIARTKLGNKMLAGTLLTDAPNVKAMIMIREDLVNSNTPPIPSAPVVQPENAPAQGISKNAEPTPKSWNPFQKAKPAVEPNLPTTLRVPAAPDPAFVPNIAGNPKESPPLLKMPGNAPTPKTPIDPPNLPALPFPDAKLDTGPTRVPSCVLVGNHLENLALKDTKGQTWEYRKHAYGKLVLIDFWYMACLPCRETMPSLNRLHQQYSSRGLEVVGIAIEKGADERKESEAINKFCTSMQVGYRQLLGRSGTFDAGKQFKVTGYPTMMLLSEQGDIIWHHVGRPDAGDLSALERLINSRLNNRPF